MTAALPANPPANSQPVSPHEIDKALINSLSKSVRRSLDEFYGQRWSAADTVPLPTPGEIAEAHELVEVALKSSPPAVVKCALAWLRVVTVSREAPSEDWILRLAAYAEELMRFPEDVVVAAVRHCGRTNRYWPALAELLEQCDQLVSKRKALRIALHSAHERLSRVPIPPEEAQRRADEWAKRYGFKSYSDLIAVEKGHSGLAVPDEAGGFYRFSHTGVSHDRPGPEAQ